MLLTLGKLNYFPLINKLYFYYVKFEIIFKLFYGFNQLKTFVSKQKKNLSS